MNALKSITKKVTEDFNNYPLLKYLKILQPSWTKIFAIKMIRKKNVLVNEQKVSPNYKINAGDIISLFGAEDCKSSLNLNLSKLKPLDVVFENEYVIIVNKEKKMAVQSDKKNCFNNMNNRLLNHLKFDLKSQQWKPVFIHRLDYNTTGLLIGAKTYTAYSELKQAFKEQKIHKYYVALVSGLIPFKQKTIKNYLAKQGDKVYSVPKDTPGSKEAITEISLIKHDFEESNSLIELKLITGRTHQIRAHLSELGYPIRGDQKYGIEKDKKRYPNPKLTAYKLVFDQTISGKCLEEIKNKVFELSQIPN